MQETDLYDPRLSEAMPTLEEINRTCQQCMACELRENCRQPIVGEGNAKASIMFVGEAPGEQEDKLGRPFVGPAGQLLDRILEVVEIRRDDVYITNIVKCRPPGNRIPKNTEVQACREFLEKQIAAIQPRIVVCLGALAAQTIIDPNARVTKIRGHWFLEKNMHVIATFHPSAILRDPQKKRPAWEDFKKIRNVYERICI
jgi:DNA polymerase